MFRKFARGGFRVPEDRFKPKFTAPAGAGLRPCEVAGLRPCEVAGKLAFFHRWVDDDRVFLKIDVFVKPEEQSRMQGDFHVFGTIPKGCSTEVQRATCALVEYADGSVGKVPPEQIRFLDRGEG